MVYQMSFQRICKSIISVFVGLFCMFFLLTLCNDETNVGPPEPQTPDTTNNFTPDTADNDTSDTSNNDTSGAVGTDKSYGAFIISLEENFGNPYARLQGSMKDGPPLPNGIWDEVQKLAIAGFLTPFCILRELLWALRS